MDTNREYLQTKYAPDRNIETLAVAFAMHYMQQHPGTKSLCDMADVLRVSPEGLNDLIVQAGNSPLLSGQRPDRLEQLASINEVRYNNFLKAVEQNNRVAVLSNPSLSADAADLALARYYLNSHNNSRFRSMASQALGMDVRTMENLFYAAAAKSLFRNENAPLLEKFASENIEKYNKFQEKMDNVLYVKSDIEPGKKLEDLIVGFAVNYINKHPDEETKERVFSALKVRPAILAELYRKAQKRPVLKGYTVPTLGKLAQLNWKRYQNFVKRVLDTDIKVQANAGDLIERMIPSRELGAAVYLMGQDEFSKNQICQVWGLSEEAFQDAIDKYSNSKEFEQNWLAGEEQKKSYIQRIIPEIERLRNDAAEILDPTYKVSGEQGIENINTVSDEARTKYLQYHPDVFAGLDKDHTTYENAMIACKACGLALEHVVNKEPRLVDYNLCMEAVKSNGYALKWVKRAWKDRPMCYAAVANNYNAYKFVPRNMKSERKLMHLAITPMGGGQNLQYAFQKDKSKYLCRMADRTFAEAREFFPQRFAPSDNELKRQARMARAQAKMQGQQLENGVKVTPQDYFDLYPTLVKEAREAIEKNFMSVRAETESFVRNMAAFYNGSISASQLLAEPPMAGRYPEDMDPAIKYRTVVLDTFACATRHPELVPAGSLNVNFKPSVQRDFSAVTIDDYYKRPAGQDKGPADQVKPFWESANMDSSMSEGVKKGLVHLLKQEAELAMAYRNGEISAEKFFSTLPMGTNVPQMEKAQLVGYANELTQYWADRFPEMVQQQKQNHSQDQGLNRSRNGGMHH
ncbi:hypothetical protein DW158_09875 [Parabacteroides merdae]|nr:hypothetical protein DW158_09875 [Parabacteroides merdae]